MNLQRMILPVAVLAAVSLAQAADPLSAEAKQAYTGIKNNMTRMAEKMPEELYSMRPGAQTEVRTFGQLVGHLADYNFLWCSQAKGEKNPGGPNSFEKTTSKDASANGSSGEWFRSWTTAALAWRLAASSSAFIPRTVRRVGGSRKCDTHELMRSRTTPLIPSSSYSAPTAAMAWSSMWVTSRGQE